MPLVRRTDLEESPYLPGSPNNLGKAFTILNEYEHTARPIPSNANLKSVFDLRHESNPAYTGNKPMITDYTYTLYTTHTTCSPGGGSTLYSTKYLDDVHSLSLGIQTPTTLKGVFSKDMTNDAFVFLNGVRILTLPPYVSWAGDLGLAPGDKLKVVMEHVQSIASVSLVLRENNYREVTLTEVTLTEIKEMRELNPEERIALSAGKLYLKLPLMPRLHLSWMGLWSVATTDTSGTGAQGSTLLRAVKNLSKVLGHCLKELGPSGVATLPGINPRKAPIQVQLGYTDDELDAFLVDATRE